MPYEVVLLDDTLPGMNGLELATEIKSDPSIGELQMILLIPVSGHKKVNELRAAGIFMQVTKPVRLSELHDCLMRVMSKSGEADPAQHLESRPLSHPEIRFDAHVLVAEDNAVNQALAQSMLENLGCQVDVVENGVQALQALSDKHYNLVCMDCQMPEMDGYEATAQIRRQEAEKEVSHRLPIIALTAESLAGDRERCLAAGMDDYLSKPFKKNQLAEVLKHWLPVVKKDRVDRLKQDSPIDACIIDEIRSVEREGAEGLLNKVIHLYLTGSPDLLASLRGSIKTADPETLTKAAHALKSSSANLGATALVSLCKILEEMGRSGSLGDAVRMMVEIDAEYERVIGGLSKIVNGRSG